MRACILYLFYALVLLDLLESNLKIISHTYMNDVKGITSIGISIGCPTQFRETPFQIAIARANLRQNMSRRPSRTSARRSRSAGNLNRSTQAGAWTRPKQLKWEYTSPLLEDARQFDPIANEGTCQQLS